MRYARRARLDTEVACVGRPRESLLAPVMRLAVPLARIKIYSYLRKVCLARSLDTGDVTTTCGCSLGRYGGRRFANFHSLLGILLFRCLLHIKNYLLIISSENKQLTERLI